MVDAMVVRISYRIELSQICDTDKCLRIERNISVRVCERKGELASEQ